MYKSISEYYFTAKELFVQDSNESPEYSSETDLTIIQLNTCHLKHAHKYTQFYTIGILYSGPQSARETHAFFAQFRCYQ